MLSSLRGNLGTHIRIPKSQEAFCVLPIDTDWRHNSRAIVHLFDIMPGKNFYEVNKPKDVAMSGLLDKQSPSMFKISWQTRYCVLTVSDKCFRYYKNEDDAQETGSINLSDMLATGPAENSDSCKIFAIKMADRTYAFEAGSNAIMKQWISSISAAKLGQRVTAAPAASAVSTKPLATAKIMTPQDFVKYGYLGKESPHALVLSYQRRYVEILKQDLTLNYYKQEPPLQRTGTEEPAGTIKCVDIEVVRPKSDPGGLTINKQSCGRVFEFYCGEGRAYVFEAVDSEEMFDWILAIESCMPEDRRAITKRLARSRPESSIGSAAVSTAEPDGSPQKPDVQIETTVRDEATTVLAGSDRPTSIEIKKPFIPHVPVPETFYMVGYLNKQSPNKLRVTLSKYQKRYVTISKHDYTLRYYNDDKHAAADLCWDVTMGKILEPGSDSKGSYVNPNTACLGFGNLLEAEFVRSYDTSPDCAIFELGFHDRTFVFDAGTVRIKNEWIRAIETVMKIGLQKLKSLELKKQELLIPETVRNFDKMGREAFQVYVREKLNELYPPEWVSAQMDSSSEEESELGKHVAGAAAVTRWLESTLPDVRKSATRPARYDVMAIIVNSVNIYLDMRLMLIIGEAESDVLQLASTSDVYQLLTLVTEHQLRLQKLYCPVHFKTSTASGTRISTNIRFTTTNFSEGVLTTSNSMLGEANEVRSSAASACRFDSDMYSPALGMENLHATDIDGVESEEKGIPIISSSSSGCSILINSAGIPVYRFQCEIFEKIPELCERYVEGSYVLGSNPRQVLREGTGKHLEDHCNKVWEKMLTTPTDFVHRHQDGTFYTETPTLIWQCLHQHLQLAIDAHSTLLHIQVADKISAALNVIVRTITAFVETMDTKSDQELQDMELEFVCALINDNALHIEEVITLVESFHNEDVKDKVNAAFDTVTDQLVRCGQTCITRLVMIIMSDMKEQYPRIYKDDGWLSLEDGDSGPVTVITATVRDYMSDFEEFLMPFWYKKFSSIIVEKVIIAYVYNVLRHNDTDDAEDAVGDMETFARINQDINELNSFLRKAMPDAIQAMNEREEARKLELSKLEAWEIKAIEEESQMSRKSSLPELDDINEDNEYLLLTQLANELNFYLTSNYATSASHAMSRISAFPSSSAAIRWFFLACMGLRDDVDEDELEECDMFIQPAMSVAPEAANYNAEHGIPEGRLGSLYDALFAMSEDQKKEAGGLDPNGNRSGNMKTHQLKMMANIPLTSLKETLKAAVKGMIDSEGYEEEISPEERASMQAAARVNSAKIRKNSVMKRSSLYQAEQANKARFQELIGILEEAEHEEQDVLGLDEAQEDSRMIMDAKLAQLQFSLEGTLEKRSPASKLWQARYFRILTKQNESVYDMSPDDNDLVNYILLWYKKKGDSVLKSFNLNRIVRMTVVESPRELAYVPELKTIVLQSEAVNMSIKSVRIITNAQPLSSGMVFMSHVPSVSAHFVFHVVAGKDPTGRDAETHELTLRLTSVDEMNKWLSAFVRFGELTYIESSGAFCKSF